MKSKTVRWLQGDREATVRHPHSCCSYQKFAVWSPYRHRKAAVWFSRHPRQGKKTYITSRPLQAPPYSHRMVTLQCVCGIAISEEKFNAKLKKMQGLRRPCGELKTVTSPYGLHKNRKAALRFGRLRSPYSRCKHTASYIYTCDHAGRLWHSLHIGPPLSRPELKYPTHSTSHGNLTNHTTALPSVYGRWKNVGVE